MCPKCQENSICKIQFSESRKVAYLCMLCNTFWFANEHMDVMNGHLLQDAQDDEHANKAFAFLNQEDKDRQEVIDEKEREAYELL